MGLFSMLLLIFFSAAGALVLRYSRTLEGPQYLASTVVAVTELCKLGICCVIALIETVTHGTGLKKGFSYLGPIIRESPAMAVPAALYVIQQLLLILAATHLDAVSFQICSQLRIPSTAVFAVLLLQQQITLVQWLSVPVLALGVAFTTISNSSAAPGTDGIAIGLTTEDWVTGIVACFVAGMSSGYASVYFEKHVKRKEGLSLWVKNIQLSMYGTPLALCVLLLKDRPRLQPGDSIFQGFSWVTAVVIGMQVMGGLSIAMVIKFADNILKNFAYALSVVVVVLVSIPIFGTAPTPLLAVGISFVIASMMMYAKVGPFAASAPRNFSAWTIPVALPSHREMLKCLRGSFRVQSNDTGRGMRMRNVLYCITLSMMIGSIVVVAGASYTYLRLHTDDQAHLIVPFSKREAVQQDDDSLLHQGLQAARIAYGTGVLKDAERDKNGAVLIASAVHDPQHYIEGRQDGVAHVKAAIQRAVSRKQRLQEHSKEVQARLDRMKGLGQEGGPKQ